MSVKTQLLEMIEFVPEEDLSVLLEVVRRFTPIGADDWATEADWDAHQTAMDEYSRGETIPHSAIKWD